MEPGGALPFLRLAPGFEIPTYFLVISLASVLGVIWCARRADARGRERALALDIAIALMIGGFVGGRLLHVVYEEPAFYWEHPAQILRFWQGGFVFFGGAIMAVACGAWVVRRKRESFAYWADFFAPMGALGYALGRVGCWLTGCCYGRVCVLPSGAEFRFPTQGLAVATEFMTLLALLAFERARSARPRVWWATSGSEFALWLFLHGLGRLAMEAFRGDDRGPQPLGLSLSSWISLALVFGAAAWAYGRRRRGKSA